LGGAFGARTRFGADLRRVSRDDLGPAAILYDRASDAHTLARIGRFGRAELPPVGDDAVLDGEIVKLDSEGRPIFIDLMRRRGLFVLVAFDCLAVNGRDARRLPLLERKKLLRAIVPRRSPALLCADHMRRRGRDLFAEVCRQDLEGIVAKRANGSLGPGGDAGLVKIKNPEYSQAQDRHELFER
jgi:ATP-dependent DNA ligase